MPANNLHSEQELLIRVAAGDEIAFRHLFDTWRDRIYTIALKLSKTESSAEDAVQEIFARLWTGRQQLPAI